MTDKARVEVTLSSDNVWKIEDVYVRYAKKEPTLIKSYFARLRLS